MVKIVVFMEVSTWQFIPQSISSWGKWWLVVLHGGGGFISSSLGWQSLADLVQHWKISNTENFNLAKLFNLTILVMFNSGCINYSVGGHSPLLGSRYRHESKHIYITWRIRTNLLKNLFYHSHTSAINQNWLPYYGFHLTLMVNLWMSEQWYTSSKK